MEADKRKRPGDGVGEEKRAKRGEDNGGSETVTEEEVEEFFAILRRIHVAIKYFEKGNGEGRKLTAWKPSFEWKDFAEVEGVQVKREDEGVEENAGLDLNADPEADPDSV